MAAAEEEDEEEEDTPVFEQDEVSSGSGSGADAWHAIRGGKRPRLA